MAYQPLLSLVAGATIQNGVILLPKAALQQLPQRLRLRVAATANNPAGQVREFTNPFFGTTPTTGSGATTYTSFEAGATSKDDYEIMVY